MKNRPVVIALVGEAGVGKDYAAAWLAQSYGYERVVSYTTRPMREGERQGVEHRFVTEFPYMDDIVCQTFYGGHRYWVSAEQLDYPVCVYVVDETGLTELMDRNRDASTGKERWKIIPVLIERSVHLRRESGVSEDRIARDAARIKLPKDTYAFIFSNNGTREEFLRKLYIVHRAAEVHSGKKANTYL